MRFHAALLTPVHFDFGCMGWSLRQLPLFAAILDIIDHRGKGSIHNVTFYALLRVLTKRKISSKQAQAIFDHIDLGLKGDIELSELGWFMTVVVGQKDGLERELLYMHAWKFWVTLNEGGTDGLTSREFRRAGLFFDFDYPTMYAVLKDYNWDDESKIEFERFRFYVISCIHHRQVRRYEAKYLRYRQFKSAMLHLLEGLLTRFTLQSILPSPAAILRGVRTLKLPPLPGTHRTKSWTDIFNCAAIRSWVARRWAAIKILWVRRMAKSRPFRCFCRCVCCGFWCFNPPEAGGCCGDCDELCVACGTSCVFCCRRCKRKRRKIVPKQGKEQPTSNEKSKEESTEKKDTPTTSGDEVDTNKVAKRHVHIMIDETEDLKNPELPSSSTEIVPKKLRKLKREQNKRKERRRDAVDEWKPLGRPKCIVL